jgi:hypothetical protein
MFRAIAITGVSGPGAVSAGLYACNQPVIVAGIAGAVFSSVLALMAASKAERASGLPDPFFSGLIAVVALVPALLLWSVESSVIHVVCHQGGSATEVVETARDLSLLVIAAAVCGLVGPVLLLVVASISRLFPARPQAVPPVRARVLAWAGLAVLLAGMTTAFVIRSSALRNAAMFGSCEGLARVLPGEQGQELAYAGTAERRAASLAGLGCSVCAACVSSRAQHNTAQCTAVATIGPPHFP